MLILSSCDFRNDNAKRIIIDNLPKTIGSCRVLFIPNEKATHESIVSGKYHRRLAEFGFLEDHVTVFDHTCPDVFRNLGIDLIYISGGNTFATLQKLRDTGFDKDIIRYVHNGVTYIGGSAGAHIVSKDVAHVAAFDDVPDGVTDFSGLGLFDGVLICHYTSEREAYFKQLQVDSTCPVYALTDDETVIVQMSSKATLATPTLAHKKQALDMIAEFEEYGSPINGDGFLSDFLRDSSYEAWIEQLEAASDPATCPNGQAPALTYFGIRESDGRIVGMIDLRLELNNHLRTHGGHIGYAVRPTEHGKHYATDMLKAALSIYKEHGIAELLVICSKDNIASAKVITNCGGILKDEIYSDIYHEVLQRYTIHIEEFLQTKEG